jgi:hypothetical protein
MDIPTLAQSIYTSSVGTAIRESETLFPLIESVHVLAITLVAGSIAVVDLRMIGLSWTSRPFSRIASEVLPYTWIAFLAAAVTGALLFTSHAVEFTQNPYFLLKMGLIALAGLNMLTFHFITSRNRAAWDDSRRPPLAVRLSGAASIVLWIGIIAAGRWIGFYLDQVRFGG